MQAGIKSHDTHTHTHTTLHKSFACTHTHSQVCSWHTQVRCVGGWVKKCMMGHIETDPWHPEEHKEGFPTSGRGEGGDGGQRSKVESGWKVADNMHKRTGGAPSTEHEQSDPLRPDGKKRRDILKGGRKVGKKVNWRCHQCGLPLLFFFFLLNIC